MNSTTLDPIKRTMIEHGRFWYVPFMDFVDEFRRSRDLSLVATPWTLDYPRYDALLALVARPDQLPNLLFDRPLARIHGMTSRGSRPPSPTAA